jgi:hypothetical protein
MAGSVPLQTADPLVGQVLDLIAILILLIYIYYYVEYRREDQQQLKREARQRATLSLLGFAFYAVLISAFGPPNTFVAPIGTRVEQYFQDLARGIFLPGIGGAPTEEQSLLSRVSNVLKLVGLVAYILLFGVLSVSNAAIANVVRFVRSRFS